MGGRGHLMDELYRPGATIRLVCDHHANLPPAIQAGIHPFSFACPRMYVLYILPVPRRHAGTILKYLRYTEVLCPSFRTKKERKIAIRRDHVRAIAVFKARTELSSDDIHVRAEKMIEKVKAPIMQESLLKYEVVSGVTPPSSGEYRDGQPREFLFWQSFKTERPAATLASELGLRVGVLRRLHHTRREGRVHYSYSAITPKTPEARIWSDIIGLGSRQQMLCYRDLKHLSRAPWIVV
ncbi:hypothetical protein B0H19DRAFT_1173123 [Mycena capillaripes]|nr:hypothetical protein B0H19DRAFT_1173123 [Mycena capillaripes]